MVDRGVAGWGLVHADHDRSAARLDDVHARFGFARGAAGLLVSDGS